MRVDPIFLPAICAVCLSACGGDPSLNGSLAEVVDLTYRKVEVLQAQDEVAVRFIMPQGAGEDIVLRVTASLVGTVVYPREPVDLAEPDPLGRTRGRITRTVTEDPLTTFPSPRRGSLTFQRQLDQGALVSGEVHVTFENGAELASGRTVFGTFEAKVQ